MSSSGASGYPAIAYHREFEGGTSRGTIRTAESGVRFENESGQLLVELPLPGLLVRQGGATGEHVYLSHPDFPDWTLTTADAAILRDPALLSEAGAARQIRGVRRGQRLLVIGCLALVLLLALGVAALVLFKEVLVTAAADRVPPEWEARLGEAAFAHIKTTMPLIEDPELNRELQQMAEPLLRAVPDSRWQYKLHLAQAEEPNAFALPGGIIVVNSGLIAAAERPEEVLGVLAHEIAHVSRRHGTRQIISRAGLWILIQATVGDVQGLAGYLVNSGEYLLTQQYSRNYEREADETGWAYLNSARLDPSGLLDFFRRMEKLEQQGKVATVPAILSTHPATEDRIAWLEARWEKEKGSGTFVHPPIDFRVFKERLKSASSPK